MPMIGFEPQTCGIGSDHSTKWATTTATSSAFLSSLNFPPKRLTQNRGAKKPKKRK